MGLQQPQDEWTFLRPDEFVDDDAVDRADEAAERGPEETAMHVHELDGDRAVTDPGRTDVSLADGNAAGDDSTDRNDVTSAPITYFDDEEPEQPQARPADRRDAEHEPDLEEILESQHYAFVPEGEQQDDAFENEGEQKDLTDEQDRAS